MQNFLFCIVNGFLYVCQVMNDQLLGKGGVVFVYLNLRVDRSKLVRISSHRLNLVDGLRNYRFVMLQMHDLNELNTKSKMKLSLK